jgi:hypothetical protein
MRRSNCAGALQYVPELTWILFLRILDERETREAEESAALGVPFTATLVAPFRWRDWAAPKSPMREDKNASVWKFVHERLLPELKALKNKAGATLQQLLFRSGELLEFIFADIRIFQIQGSVVTACRRRDGRSLVTSPRKHRRPQGRKYEHGNSEDERDYTHPPLFELCITNRVFGTAIPKPAAKIRSSRNSPCWQLSAVVHDQPVAFQHRRISRVLIEIAQRWIVETGATEQLGAGLSHHRDQTEMNKFGRLFANDMDAEQSHVVLPKDQFQQPAFIADNLAARIIGITRPTT